VLQWRHYEPDEGDEEMTSDVEEEIFTAVDDYEDLSQTNAVNEMVYVGHTRGVPQYVPAAVARAMPSRDIPPNSGLDPGSRLAFLPCASSMVSLKLQKRLAASVLRCGQRKIWCDPNEVR